MATDTLAIDTLTTSADNFIFFSAAVYSQEPSDCSTYILTDTTYVIGLPSVITGLTITGVVDSTYAGTKINVNKDADYAGSVGESIVLTITLT